MSTMMYGSSGEGEPYRPVTTVPEGGLAEVLAALYDFVTKAGPGDLLVLRPSQAVAILNGADDVRRAIDELGRFTATGRAPAVRPQEPREHPPGTPEPNGPLNSYSSGNGSLGS